MLADPETYEIMLPADVGVRETELVLGKHSGKHAVSDRAKQMGYVLEDSELDQVMERFKELADRKKRIFDADLEAIITESQVGTVGPWSLAWLSVVSRVNGEDHPTASLTLAHRDGETTTQTGIGDGPVDAIVNALAKITRSEIHVLSLAMRSISLGEDAQGEASLRATCDGVEYSGHGLSTDIVAACAEALLEIVNRADRNQEFLRSKAQSAA
jgi:2-isopropylmalate synthase